MDTLKTCPKVLLHKLLLTALTGVGCLVVGAAYFCFARDAIFLLLSAAVFFGTMARTAGLYRLISKKQFEIVEGVCVGISPKPLRRYRKVHIMRGDGVESAVLLGKQVRVKIGYGYRFYFKSDARPLLGSEYLDTALSSDRFLGFEELGEFASSKKAEEDAE